MAELSWHPSDIAELKFEAENAGPRGYQICYGWLERACFAILSFLVMRFL
jgi:hypothetical protein